MLARNALFAWLARFAVSLASSADWSAPSMTVYCSWMRWFCAASSFFARRTRRVWTYDW
jgi:hypothetical protein